MAKTLHIAPNRHAVHPFDVKYGTDTGGYLGPEELGGGTSSVSRRAAIGAGHEAMNNGYSAVAPSVFREACRRWREVLPLSAARVDAYTFVDVGAGKGRALLLAAELPFRKVIGVELNGALARIAQHNVALWTRRAQGQRGPAVRVLHQDATEFRWPRAPLLIYLNNPFACALVAELARRVTKTAKPALVDVLYVNPGCAEALVCEGLFTLLWSAEIKMDEDDQQADPYDAISDRVSAFRLAAR